MVRFTRWFTFRPTFRPNTALIVTATVLALATVEVWALSPPVLAEWPVALPAGWSARESSILFDLILVLPLMAATLVWVWSRPRFVLTGPKLPQWLTWLRPWIRPRRLLYLLIPYAIAQLSALELGLGHILAAVAGLAIIGEIFALGVMAAKLVQIVRATRVERRAGYSFTAAIAVATEKAFGVVPLGPAMRLAVFEVTQIYHLTAGWFVPRKPAGAHTFTYHRRRDETLMIAFSMIIVIEAVPLHAVVHHYSPLAAWILTGLHVYSLLWTLGDLAAARQRPHTLSGSALRLSQGLWREAVVELGNIRAVIDARQAEAEQSAATDAGGDDDDSGTAATFGSRHDVTLELREPIAVYGLVGSRQGVTTVRLALDEPDEFLEELSVASCLMP